MAAAENQEVCKRLNLCPCAQLFVYCAQDVDCRCKTSPDATPTCRKCTADDCSNQNDGTPKLRLPEGYLKIWCGTSENTGIILIAYNEQNEICYIVHRRNQAKHAERVLLDGFDARLKEVPTYDRATILPYWRGRILLVVSRCPCDRCAEAILAFRKLLPDVKNFEVAFTNIYENKARTLVSCLRLMTVLGKANVRSATHADFASLQLDNFSDNVKIDKCVKTTIKLAAEHLPLVVQFEKLLEKSVPLDAQSSERDVFYTSLYRFAELSERAEKRLNGKAEKLRAQVEAGEKAIGPLREKEKQLRNEIGMLNNDVRSLQENNAQLHVKLQRVKKIGDVRAMKIRRLEQSNDHLRAEVQKRDENMRDIKANLLRFKQNNAQLRAAVGWLENAVEAGKRKARRNDDQLRACQQVRDNLLADNASLRGNISRSQYHIRWLEIEIGNLHREIAWLRSSPLCYSSSTGSF